MIERFTNWHKARIECVADYFNMSHYQLLWAAALKGILIGYIVGEYL